MDKSVLITFFIATAIAMPVWMAWRKANKRPWLVGCLLVVGLLILPYGLTVWLHPDWLNQPVTNSVKHLVLLPALLSLCALGGGLVYLMVPLALALLIVSGKALGEAYKDMEYQQDDDQDEGLYPDPHLDPHEAMYGDGSQYQAELLEGFEEGREHAW